MTMRLPVLPSKNRFISSCDILCLVFLTMVLLLPADALYASANCTFHHTHLHEHEAHPETKNITEVTDQHHPTAMYPQELGNPLDPPLILAGTFGELRSNHFHGGLDIKTGGVENWKIYSIADGYVSRIKVSSGGYGKAIYVTHPNGYTSVYAHVNGFFPELDEYIQNQQYARQSFYFDDAIPADLFPVKKGQVIAKSGNTGSSTAPHLHFEIRDTFSEAALNPLLFGYQVADTRLPLIEQLGVYPILDFNKKGTPKTYDVKKVNGKYALANGQNLLQLPYYQVGLGLKAYDKQNAANNLNGIYSLKVFDNGNPIYGFRVDRIPFEETRYLNAHLDYGRKLDRKGNMQKCFVDPGNQLSIYESVQNYGHINLSDGLLHKIVFEVKDIKGNTSFLSVMLQQSPNTLISTTTDSNYEMQMSYAMDNFYDTDQISIQLPYGCFYEDISFKYKTYASGEPGIYSQVHKVHDYHTPVQKYFDIAIKPSNLPSELYDQAIIVYKDHRGRKRSIGGKWEGNYLKARSRTFGDYYITTDTKPPRIKPYNISNGKNMSKNTQIIFSIGDDLSGVATYNCYVDGQWILMNYDGKSGRIRHYFKDGKIGKGAHELRLVVKDGAGNENVYTANFTR